MLHITKFLHECQNCFIAVPVRFASTLGRFIRAGDWCEDSSIRCRQFGCASLIVRCGVGSPILVRQTQSAFHQSLTNVTLSVAAMSVSHEDCLPSTLRG